MEKEIEFVASYFDTTFSAVLNKPDPRIKNLRKFCNTILKMKKDRSIGNQGDVSVNVQVLDDFKFLDGAIMGVMQRIENGSIKIYNEEGKEISKIMVASFGVDSKGVESVSGWSGSVTNFLDAVNSTIENEKESEFKESNTHYLRHLPESIVKNKKDVEYIIIGIIICNDDNFYDKAGISIIGIPDDRSEEFVNKTVLNMFNY